METGGFGCPALGTADPGAKDRGAAGLGGIDNGVAGSGSEDRMAEGLGSEKRQAADLSGLGKVASGSGTEDKRAAGLGGGMDMGAAGLSSPRGQWEYLLLLSKLSSPVSFIFLVCSCLVSFISGMSCQF